jgi:hypothetical protein
MADRGRDVERGAMPSYEVSPEARWLTVNWPELGPYAGRWIAVVGEGVGFDATSFGEVAEWADAHVVDPLFAFVPPQS